MKPSRLILLLVILGMLFVQTRMVKPVAAQAPLPVVQAVLFYSPTCSHCIYVITEVLPPIFEQYGQQLELFTVNVTQMEGQVLFLDTLAKFGVDRGAVPFLVVGNEYMVGSIEIPEQFPALLASKLAEGGVGWPDLPGLTEYMAVSKTTQLADLVGTPLPGSASTSLAVIVENTPIPADTTLVPLPDLPTATIIPIPLDTTPPILAEKLAQDPVGNNLAIVVLVGMLVCLGWGTWAFLTKPGRPLTGIPAWSILLLCILGLGVAGYLTYVETQQVDAYCGLVGDCNTVQQSEYARLFGVLPVGWLGLAGFITILAAWLGIKFARGKWAEYASLALLILSVIATLFSIYLTFLEPFVIGATCSWCLTSAVISTLLMLLSIAPGKLAFTKVVGKKA